MSYVAVRSFGQAEDNCDGFLVSGDGRCADTAGVHSLSWYDLRTGRCVPPPSTNCDVNARNLPSSCPSGQMLNTASEVGCSPLPRSSGGGAISKPAPSDGVAVSAAGVSGSNALVAVVLGLGLVYLLGKQS